MTCEPRAWSLKTYANDDHVEGKALWSYLCEVSRCGKCAKTESKSEIPSYWRMEVVDIGKSNIVLRLLKFLIELLFVEHWEYK